MTYYRERIILKVLWGIPTELKRGIEMEEKKNLWSSYDEAANVIRKRIRETEYEQEIQNILRKQY